MDLSDLHTDGPLPDVDEFGFKDLQAGDRFRTDATGDTVLTVLRRLIGVTGQADARDVLWGYEYINAAKPYRLANITWPEGNTAWQRVTEVVR